MEKCHVLGPKSYRVTKKYELSTITSPLFDLDMLNVDFSVNGMHITGMALRRVGADMDMNKIETYVDPSLPTQGWTDVCGQSPSNVRVIFEPSNISPFGISAQALVVHEGVHAWLRRTNMPSGGHFEEAAAYLAQALFFELKGDSILQTWVDDNQWAFNQPHIDDPIGSDSKARVYAAAEKLVERFQLDTRCVHLTAADVKELVDAIAKDPGYATPAKPKPPPPRTKTLRERLRERREARRARWAEHHS